MEPELPPQGHCLARLMPQTSEMFKQGTIPFRMSPGNLVSQRTVYRITSKQIL